MGRVRAKWETCPRCRGDHIVPRAFDRCVPLRVTLWVRTRGDPSGPVKQEHWHPVLELRDEVIELSCLDCGHRWKG